MPNVSVSFISFLKTYLTFHAPVSTWSCKNTWLHRSLPLNVCLDFWIMLCRRQHWTTYTEQSIFSTYSAIAEFWKHTLLYHVSPVLLWNTPHLYFTYASGWTKCGHAWWNYDGVSNYIQPVSAWLFQHLDACDPQILIM